MPGHDGMESLEQREPEMFPGKAKSTGLHFNLPAEPGVFSPKEVPQGHFWLGILNGNQRGFGKQGTDDFWGI